MEDKDNALNGYDENSTFKIKANSSMIVLQSKFFNHLFSLVANEVC